VDKIYIKGGKPLNGEINISGSKNAALPALAATLLTADEVLIKNLPLLSDVESMQNLLASHGALHHVIHGNAGLDSKERCLKISCAGINNFTAHYDLVRKMRASVLVLGPLLARFGEAYISLPGGCAIGNRPVDIHINSLIKMGAQITIENGYINAHCKGRLKGADILLPFPSVGATENIMMAATLAEGVSIIHNAAKEPEIEDLARLLKKMGAQISGEGSEIITIQGVDKLHGAEHSLIGDRIEAGTYIIAAGITGGKLKINNIDHSLLGSLDLVDSPLFCFSKAGIEIEFNNDNSLTASISKIKAIELQTAPFPLYATDLQAQIMSLLSLADGVSVITENIFENRFMHVPELNRMGANIHLQNSHKTAIIHGVNHFKGAPVMATDLRASVALVLAGLAANGTTEVNRIYHLDRGYENLVEKLAACGAEISRSN
jgi:UDP-N-acetylglucosamine 1-carboxyvinyltransferase